MILHHTKVMKKIPLIAEELVKHFPRSRLAIEQALALGINYPRGARSSLVKGAVVSAGTGGVIAELVVGTGAIVAAVAVGGALEGALGAAGIGTACAARRGLKRGSRHLWGVAALLLVGCNCVVWSLKF